MTTIEAYYLAMCAGAFIAFALALGYNAWSWKSWKDSSVGASPKQPEPVETKMRLAA